MRKFSLVLVFILLMVAVISVSAQTSTRHFYVDLAPLNHSGVQGTAHLILKDGVLTVSIEASGLEAGKTHAQHIHGFDNPSNATCPTADADTDGDGLVSVVEGLPSYGPVLISLTPFSTAPGGLLEYTQPFDDLSLIEPVNTLQNRAIVLHGMTVNGNYIGSLPVACGQIRPAPNGGK